METITLYFVVGFVAAFGAWTAGKVTDRIDAHIEEKLDEDENRN